MQYSEDTFTTGAGLTLFMRRWQPASSPRATIALVHGAWEHSGRYQHVAAHLTGAGYAVHAVDLRGHGKSEGRPAYAESPDEYLTDVEHFLAYVRENTSSGDLYLMGHSMGGGIVTLYAIERQPAVAGVILSGALLKLHPPALLQRLVVLIARIAPNLPILRVDGSGISRNPDVVAAYRNDPLVHTGWANAAMMSVITRIAGRIRPAMEKMRQPALVMHGTADELTDPEGSRQLFRRAGSEDTTLKLYDGLYHEIMNEPEREQVLSDVVAWLNTRA